MKTTEAKAIAAPDAKLLGREVVCRRCGNTVSVVALPGAEPARIGWHRIVDKAAAGTIARPVYVSCPGSWSLVTQ